VHLLSRDILAWVLAKDEVGDMGIWAKWLEKEVIE
jgi:hypothetical protein